MTEFPTPHTLHIRRAVEVGEDRYRNPVVTHSDDLEPWQVHAYYAPTTEEPFEAGRDASVIDMRVLAPARVGLPGVHDLVVIEGVDFTVEGAPRDYSRGPFGFSAGAVVNLKRVEG